MSIQEILQALKKHFMDDEDTDFKVSFDSNGDYKIDLLLNGNWHKKVYAGALKDLIYQIELWNKGV